MRESLNTKRLGWVRAGAFWTAVLLVLPNCSFDPSGASSGSNLPKGSTPHNDLIFCDIERPAGRHCSDALERARGIRLSEAAVALAEGRSMDVGLDDSPEALARCGGEPEAVLFQGPFPQGFPVCLNCTTAIGTPETPTVTVACQKQCLDFFGTVDAEGDVSPDTTPSPELIAFCNAVSRSSTGLADSCLVGFCDDGDLQDPFDDPRRTAEPVVWQDLIGVAAGGGAGNDLTRTAPFTGVHDAGAVSTQLIARGDAYVEFSASRADQSHIQGLSQIPATCPAPCPDTDPTFETISFATGLGDDGRIRVFETGVPVPGPDINGTFGLYAPGERFRVRLRDNGDGTASVRYTRLVGPCIAGTVCNEQDLHASTRLATYPLRVDTSLFDVGGTITDVRLVRIR